MEPRAADLALIENLRFARVAAVEKSSMASVSSVLMSDRAEDQFVYVVKLLDVHPALGKVAGRRVLTSLGLTHFSRVSDLNEAQRTAIRQACGETA